MSKWLMKSNGADTSLMSKALGVSPVMAYVLATKGLRTKQEALLFLYPPESAPDDGPNDGMKLKDAYKAAELISEAIQGGIRTAIFGDYDVDGVISTYMLHKSLSNLGADSHWYLPRRTEDGYGLNEGTVRGLCDAGTGLLICCDNGVSAFEEIELANSLGMQVIVIDHHEPRIGGEGQLLPPAAAVIDPKRSDCEYGCKGLCAAALVYKFLRCLHGYMELPFGFEDEYTALAALASVCDVVDITGETRLIVKRGLRVMGEKRVNLGLSALIREKGLDGGELSVYDLGFILGPCINAGGRLQSAEIAMGLFLAEDNAMAEAFARKLSELNELRKDMTSESVERALENAESDKVIVYYDEEIHEGLTGIVAGKVREALCRPAVVLTRSGGLAKGSARSVEGYDMFRALSGCGELFVKFGGHEMAAGMSLEADKVPELRRRLNADCRLGPDDFTPVYRIEKEIALSDITFSLAKELCLLEPYGTGNREPLFATRNVVPETVEIIGESRRTLRMSFEAEGERRRIKAVCFGKAGQFARLMGQRFKPAVIENFLAGRIKEVRIPLDIIYMIELNRYNGSEYLQIKIEDFRLANRSL